MQNNNLQDRIIYILKWFLYNMKKGINEDILKNNRCKIRGIPIKCITVPEEMKLSIKRDVEEALKSKRKCPVRV